MKRFIALRRVPIICFFLAACCSHVAFAQSKIPQISVSPDYKAPLALDNKNEISNSFDMIPNEQLAGQLKLQHQIFIMERLIARQNELKKISEVYGKMGLTFTEPPPPRALCEQIPVNTLCLSHYKDLYPESISSVRADFDAEMTEIRKALAGNNTPSGSIDDEKAWAEAERKRKIALEAARRKQELTERKGRYQWTDIRCTNNNCTAVLITRKNPSVRFTVKERTQLPDGTFVQDISEEGIKISIKGDVVDVQGAPIEDNPDTKISTSVPQQNNPRPENSAANAVNTNTVINTPALETAPPQGTQASANPALAPSNMF